MLEVLVGVRALTIMDMFVGVEVVVTELRAKNAAVLGDALAGVLAGETISVVPGVVVDVLTAINVNV